MNLVCPNAATSESTPSKQCVQKVLDPVGSFTHIALQIQRAVNNTTGGQNTQHDLAVLIFIGGHPVTTAGTGRLHRSIGADNCATAL
ncbi:hypothetical protein HPB50_008276 [Hyalomma asiaticum]|uniref:Uncharacterized protein n=1 Tax=Hyalomma asiaticum TaxID=266040 RepID=A0ACB7SPI8_HYAAI|nr:hypothetical protein HPB50_008276 [Hyalomma asiaticum]